MKAPLDYHFILYYYIFFQWAALVRSHVRVNRGLPPLHDLLSVDQEYVVRSVAYALRNLAIDRTNKWSIGKSEREFF